jgi:hypothetical protein
MGVRVKAPVKKRGPSKAVTVDRLESRRPGRILVGTASWSDPGFVADFSHEEINEIAIDTHIIFNNNNAGYAPRAAGRFQRVVAGQAAPARA